jgi:hypothetical protein
VETPVKEPTDKATYKGSQLQEEGQLPEKRHLERKDQFILMIERMNKLFELVYRGNLF